MTRNQRGHNIWRSHFSSPRTWRNNKNWWCNKKLELILQCWKFCLGKKQFNREKGKGKPTLDMYVVLLQLLCFYYSVSVDVDYILLIKRQEDEGCFTCILISYNINNQNLSWKWNESLIVIMYMGWLLSNLNCIQNCWKRSYNIYKSVHFILGKTESWNQNYENYIATFQVLKRI